MPVTAVKPATKKGAATSRRILDAAAAEFAEFGIAGARVERITAAAQTNKAQLYGYFGSKDGLFDAVIADRVTSTTAAIPFDVERIPEWAVQVYDENLRHPELTRLIAWVRLERRRSGTWFDGSDHDAKLAAITEAQAEGRIRQGDPFTLLTMIISMASTWSAASEVYTATADEPESVHESRRTLLRESVARLLAP
ncbi:TetR family transcriptional regulator [Gryllotalpicola kribbensis]|jgi:AcrR family transcriptional regulator|uniref:TetR family transcriptional regulator n=1 Tax=Gryllotalpicola kribbensis TaxID=993084 RepID=A0ABP8AV08_9MICO